MRYGRPRTLMLALIACVVCAVTVIVATGCTSESSKGGDISGINWILTSYSDGDAMQVAPKGANGVARFTGEEVAGHLVNDYSGPFVTDRKGNVTSAGPFEATQMAGPQNLMDVETAYLANLGKATSYYSDGTNLTLYGEDDKELLVYQAGGESVLGAWRVTAYKDATQNVVDVIPGTVVTATFDTAGRITGNGGVNEYSANYSLQGANEISVGTATADQMSGSQEAMDQQVAYLAALMSAKTYKASGSTLELFAADGTTAVQMEAAK